MPNEFLLPDLGEGIKSADIASLLVKEGDTVQAGQNVLELETDKAVVELPIQQGGRIEKIHVKAGQSVSPGALIMTLAGAGVSTPAPAPSPTPAKPAAATATPVTAAPAAPAPTTTGGGSQTFTCPDLGEGIKSADVAQVLVSAGQTISSGQNVIEIETDKAAVEIPCPWAGTITQVHVQPGKSIQPGQPVLTLTTSASVASVPSVPASPAPAVAPSPAPVATAPAKAVTPVIPAVIADKRLPAPAGPATRRIARQFGVDLYQVAGTGRNGRITIDDVQAYVRSILQGQRAAPNAPAPAKETPKLPDFTQFGAVERKAMNKIAKTSAANLSWAWQSIPHVTQHDLADVTELEGGRKRHVQNQKSGQPKVTMTVLAIKAVVAALKQFPHFNSSIDTETNEIIYKQYYHIGVAVDTEYGLVVPVIRDVNQKSIVEIARELDQLAAKARDRKLSPSDFQGGTFTITNLGGIGGTMFSPIVNWPEVAILGMSRAKQQLVIIDGEPQTRLMLPLSLSYDHRVINGADAARFIVKVTSLLADPSQLLIES